MSIEIYPVVHVNDVRGSAAQSELALEAGADGIFLIDHRHRDTDTLFETFTAVSNRNPVGFIGLNLLQVPAVDSALDCLYDAVQHGALSRFPDGLWADDGKFGAENAQTMRAGNPVLRKIELFGGAAFKYTTHFTDDPGLAALEAKSIVQYADTIVTSGEGTGQAPGSDKIQAMKQAIGAVPLAIASGVTIDNLSTYSGYIDKLLVSSSIETSPYSGIFDPAKLKDLIAEAHAD